MRRFVGVLVVLVPLSLVLAGCVRSAPENPEKTMQVQEMQMPPDLAKKYKQETKAPGAPTKPDAAPATP